MTIKPPLMDAIDLGFEAPTGGMSDCVHIDRNGRLGKPTVNSRGEVTVEGVAAREGILVYRYAGGRTVRQLVTLDALQNTTDIVGTPITINHPSDRDTPRRLVNPKTRRRLSVGIVVDSRIEVAEDGAHELILTMMFTDSRGIKALQDGKLQELSPGYLPDVVPQGGQHPVFGAYDMQQVGRTLNHVAALPPGNARGGRQCSIQLDSEDNMNKFHLLMALIGLPALDSAATEDDAFEAVKAGVTGLTNDLKAEQGKVAVLTDSNKKLQSDLDAANEKIAASEQSANRAPLVEKATAYGVQVDDNMSNLDIQKAIAKVAAPGVNLDDMDDAVFSGVWTMVEAMPAPKPKTFRTPIVNPVNTDAKGSGTPAPSGRIPVPASIIKKEG